MNSWVNHAGYPLVTVTRNYETNQVELKQERFFEYPLTNTLARNEHFWSVPINYATASNPNFNDTRPEFWLRKSSSNAKLNVDSKDWIILNKQQTGFTLKIFYSFSYKN